MMGLLYALFADKLPLPAIVKGLLFGLLVWAASYLGLLPLLGLTESAPTEPTRRNLLMIAARMIWGASTGAVADVLMQTREATVRQSQNLPAYIRAA
jgi:uncharacterized membrane protein YagU involved in acid resistance